MVFLVKLSLRALAWLKMVLKLMLRVSRLKNEVKRRFNRNKESAEPMKKTYLIAIIAALAAVAGALTAAAIYLRRREKELDEYEKLLFGEDEAEAEAEAPAEEAAAEEPAEEGEPAAETDAE